MTGFAESIRAFQGKTEARMDQIVRKVCMDVTADIVRLTPVDTGMARSNWFVGYSRVSTIDRTLEKTTVYGAIKQFSGDFSSGPKTLSDRDALAAMRWLTGAKTDKRAFSMAKTMLKNDRAGGESNKRASDFASTLHAGGVFYITNNLPYIMRLEYGSSKQSPAGMARVTCSKWQARLDRLARSL